MDPEANLQEQLSLAAEIIAKHESDEIVDQDDAARLAELVIDLDVWLRAGGFLPGPWRSD